MRRHIRLTVEQAVSILTLAEVVEDKDEDEEAALEAILRQLAAIRGARCIEAVA